MRISPFLITVITAHRVLNGLSDGIDNSIEIQARDNNQGNAQIDAQPEQNDNQNRNQGQDSNQDSNQDNNKGNTQGQDQNGNDQNGGQAVNQLQSIATTQITKATNGNDQTTTQVNTQPKALPTALFYTYVPPQVKDDAKSLSTIGKWDVYASDEAANIGDADFLSILDNVASACVDGNSIQCQEDKSYGLDTNLIYGGYLDHTKKKIVFRGNFASEARLKKAVEILKQVYTDGYKQKKDVQAQQYGKGKRIMDYNPIAEGVHNVVRDQNYVPKVVGVQFYNTDEAEGGKLMIRIDNAATEDSGFLSDLFGSFAAAASIFAGGVGGMLVNGVALTASSILGDQGVSNPPWPY